MLFLLNTLTALGFVVAYVAEASSARETCKVRGKVQLKIVDDEGRVLRALSAAAGEHAAKPTTPERWWTEERVHVGANVTHPTRGRGKVIAISPDQDQRVHVEFAVLGDVHRYNYASWGKFFSMHDLFASALEGIDYQAGGDGGDEGSGKGGAEDAVQPSNVDALGDTAAGGGAAGASAASEATTLDESTPLLWRHPEDIAVEDAPTKLHDAKGSAVWLYTDPTLAVSAATPELLIAVTGSEPLVHGDRYRWVHPQTRRLSAPHVELIDVGGCPERVSTDARSEIFGANAGFELQLTKSRDAGTGIDLSLEVEGAHGVETGTRIEYGENNTAWRKENGPVSMGNPLVRARPISLVGPIANV